MTKISVNGLGKQSEVFTYLRQKYPKINKTNMTERALIGQQIANQLKNLAKKLNYMECLLGI
jgi:hypothetical protein